MNTKINLRDMVKFGVTMEPPEMIAVGDTYWKIVGVEHISDQRPGAHHVFVEALDSNGNKLRGVSVVFELWDALYSKTLDKNLDEYGVDWPMWRGNFVSVYMEGHPSDRVYGLNGERGAWNGGDWFHHSWLVVFQLAKYEGDVEIEEPEEPGDVVVPDNNKEILDSLWDEYLKLDAANEELWVQYADLRETQADLLVKATKIGLRIGVIGEILTKLGYVFPGDK